MAVFLVPDNGRSLCLLTATNLAAAQEFAARFLPTCDWDLISGTGLSDAEQAAELQWCRMAPISMPPVASLGDEPAAVGALSRLAHISTYIAGAEPTDTGVLARLDHAHRSLAGSEPAATGNAAT